MSRDALLLPGLAALALGGVLAAESVTRPKQEPGKVTISYWEKWTGFEFDAMKAVVEEFNRSQDRIEVKILPVSSIDQKAMMSIAAGVPPDVAGLFGPNVAQYVDDNAIIPLTQYMEEAGLTRDYYVHSYYDIGVYRGEVWSVPSTPASTALHYNKAMFREAGLDPDTPPATLEELDALAEKLTVRNGSKIERSGFLPSEPGWWNWAWGYYFGGTLWDGGGQITCDSPENIRAFEWVQSYPQKYGPGAIQTFQSGFGNFQSPQNAFMSNQVAMVKQGVWMYNFIDKFAPKMEWTAAPFPHPKDRPDLAQMTMVDEDVLVIPRGAKHPDEAFEFIKFVQSQKGMELLCLGQRKNSPLAEVSDEFYKKHPHPYIRLFTELAKSPNAVAPPKLGIWQEYTAELNNAYSQINLMEKSPEDALQAVKRRMQPRLEQYQRRLKMRGLL